MTHCFSSLHKSEWSERGRATYGRPIPSTTNFEALPHARRCFCCWVSVHFVWNYWIVTLDKNTRVHHSVPARDFCTVSGLDSSKCQRSPYQFCKRLLETTPRLRTLFVSAGSEIFLSVWFTFSGIVSNVSPALMIYSPAGACHQKYYTPTVTMHQMAQTRSALVQLVLQAGAILKWSHLLYHIVSSTKLTSCLEWISALSEWDQPAPGCKFIAILIGYRSVCYRVGCIFELSQKRGKMWLETIWSIICK